MQSPVKRPLIALLLLPCILLIFSCGKDDGVAPIGETDFWRQTNGPGVETVRSLAINQSGHIFAGTWGGGVFRSEDNGDNWTAVNTGLINTYVQALAINQSGHIFAGTEAGVFRSQDNGGSWVNTGLTNTDIQALAINADGHIFAGTYGGGVFRSQNNGGSWTAVNTGLTSTYVWALAINANGHIFAGTYQADVCRSVDNGDHWTRVDTGLIDNADVRALACLLYTSPSPRDRS